MRLRHARLFMVVATALALLLAGAGEASAAKKKFSKRATISLIGSTIAGDVVTAKPSRWGAKRVHYSYRWFIGESTAAGATTPSVSLGRELAGQRVTVQVTGKKKHYRQNVEARSFVVGAPAVVSGETNLPGRVVLNPMQMQATEHFIWDPVLKTYYSNRVFSTYGALIYRSPATSGAQSMSVTYYLQTSQYGSWQNVAIAPPTFTGTFVAESLATGFFSTEPPQAIARTGYRYVYGVTWFDANGTRIGYAEVNGTQPQDAVCQTQQRLCEPKAGWVFV
jgi:hypothetical protein